MLVACSTMYLPWCEPFFGAETFCAQAFADVWEGFSKGSAEGAQKGEIWSGRPGARKSLKSIGLGEVFQGVRGGRSETGNLVQEAGSPEFIKIDRFGRGFPRGSWRALRNRKSGPGGREPGNH